MQVKAAGRFDFICGRAYIMGIFHRSEERQMHRPRGIRLLGLLAGVLLPWSAQAGFGFGFDSDNGFYDYDPEDYARWGYPPPGYRDYNPRWRWGSDGRDGTWRWGSRPKGSGWRYRSGRDDSGWHRGKKPKKRKSSSWWDARRLKGDDGWSSWGREWSFGRDSSDPVKMNFGSFDWGDRWSPSFGKKSWSFGRKPRWYRYPPPPPYPAWGQPYGAPVPWWGAAPQAAPSGGQRPAAPPSAGQAAAPVTQASKAPATGSETPKPSAAETKDAGQPSDAEGKAESGAD